MCGFDKVEDNNRYLCHWSGVSSQASDQFPFFKQWNGWCMFDSPESDSRDHSRLVEMILHLQVCRSKETEQPVERSWLQPRWRLDFTGSPHISILTATLFYCFSFNTSFFLFLPHLKLILNVKIYWDDRVTQESPNFFWWGSHHCFLPRWGRGQCVTVPA